MTSEQKENVPLDMFLHTPEFLKDSTIYTSP